MERSEIKDTINKYESFINDVLKEDLRVLQTRLQEINAEISDLIQQKQTLKVVTDKSIHPDGFKSQIDIGCNFFMEAAVKDTSKMLIHIGLNYYLEFTLPEALKYLDVRIKGFEEKGSEIKKKSAETKAHIKLLLIGIAELQSKS